MDRRNEVLKFLFRYGAPTRLRIRIEADMERPDSLITDIKSLYKIDNEYFLEMAGFGKASLWDLRDILRRNSGDVVDNTTTLQLIITQLREDLKCIKILSAHNIKDDEQLPMINNFCVNSLERSEKSIKGLKPQFIKNF